MYLTKIELHLRSGLLLQMQDKLKEIINLESEQIYHRQSSCKNKTEQIDGDYIKDSK